MTSADESSDPVFTSSFKDYFLKFIEEKKQSGNKYNSSTKILQRLDRFLAEHGSGKLCIEKDLVEKWCAFGHGRKDIETVKSNACRRSALRVFSEFLISENVPVEALPPKLRKVNSSKYNHYIYTDDDLRALYEAAGKLKPLSNSPFRHIVMPMAIKILSLTGLRIGEALNLRVCDFLYNRRRLRILGAKNDRDRVVPVTQGFADQIQDFIEFFHAASEPSDYLLPIRPGKKFSNAAFHRSFVTILQQSGIGHTSYSGPRVHDLRHTYCVNILRHWKKNGIDANSMLPALACVLGHSSITETSLYLHSRIEDMEDSEVIMAESYPQLCEAIDYDGDNTYRC